MMKFKWIIISILLCGGCCGTVHADQEIWKTSLPPSHIELDHAITLAFAKKFNAALSAQKVPFARRLSQLKAGEIDLLSGLLKNDDREKYAHFLTPPYKQKTNKYFFVRKGEGKRLQKYEDLYQLRIGVQIGSKYFPRFDQDTKLNKTATSHIENRFQMLVRGRLDAIIHTDIYGLDIMYKKGLQKMVEVAPFSHNKYNPVYMAISYKSKLIERKDELEEVLRKMVESGEMDQVIHQYLESKGLPVPEYK